MGGTLHRTGWTSRARGFTLLELLVVVVVIIGVLAGFVAPRYFGQVGKSEVNVAKAQIDALGKALDQYRLDVGRYPSKELGLKAVGPDGAVEVLDFQAPDEATAVQSVEGRGYTVLSVRASGP